MTARHYTATAPALTLADLSVLLLMQTIWGAGTVVSKFALAEIPPLLFVALRFLAVSALLLPLLRWHPGQMHHVVAIAFFSGAAHYGLMTVGLQQAVDVAPVAIAAQLVVPFATLLSVAFLGERLGIWRSSALAIAFAGILVVGFDPVVLRYGWALVLVAISALTMAIGTIFMRKVRGVPVYPMQAWIAMFTWPPVLVVSFLLEGSPVPFLPGIGLASWLALGFVIVGVSLVAHAAYFWIMQRHEVALTAPFLLLWPILAALGGVVLLGNALTWRMAVGGAMTLAGVLIITLREGRQRRREPPPEPGP